VAKKSCATSVAVRCKALSPLKTGPWSLAMIWSGAARDFDLHVRREAIVKPDSLAGLDRRRGLHRGGIDVFEFGKTFADFRLLGKDGLIEVGELLLRSGRGQLKDRRVSRMLPSMAGSAVL